MYQIDFNHPSSIYFVGIGGISMSGLAEILKDAGFRVSGSDRSKSPLTETLERKGINVFYGQRAGNITDDIDCVVFTSAIHKDNPEYVATMEKGIPHLTRAQLLGEIMQNYKTPIAISGTHGKTTTTSMVSEILLHAGTDPTLSIGGMLKSIGGNIRVGSTDLFVTEACEYTNSFLSFFPRIGMILNIEEDHLDFFKDLEDIRNSFHKFAKLLPADGCLIINGAIDRLQEITGDLDCRVITFNKEAVNSDGSAADYYPSDITYDEFGHPSFTLHRHGEVSGSFSLQVPGEHNVCNAIASIALADLLKIDREVTASALHGFTGTDRRFEYKGTIGGVTIVDDYAHHPTEIQTTIKAAKQTNPKRLIVAFQPHRYSRTQLLQKEFGSCFVGADVLVLTDIYAASEDPIEGISGKTIVDEVKKQTGVDAVYIEKLEDIAPWLKENIQAGDLIITMGAGNIYTVGENLAQSL